MVYEKLEFDINTYKVGTLAKCELNTDKNKYIFHNDQKSFNQFIHKMKIK